MKKGLKEDVKPAETPEEETPLAEGAVKMKRGLTTALVAQHEVSHFLAAGYEVAE